MNEVYVIRIDENNKVVVVEGVAEPYYFHIISRDEHQKIADMIAEGHHRDFDK